MSNDFLEYAQLVNLIRAAYSLDYGFYSQDLSTAADLIIKKVYADYKSFLSTTKMAKLAFYVEKQKNFHRDGIFVEFGCALGGSSAIIGSLKEQYQEFLVFDVFDLIPSPTEQDSTASCTSVMRFSSIWPSQSLSM